MDMSSPSDPSSYSIELLTAEGRVAASVVASGHEFARLFVPADLPPGPAILRVTAAGWAQNVSVTIKDASDGIKVMLQTDKHIYRPGQRVLVRALCVNAETLRPRAAFAISLDLLAPGGIIVARQVGPSGDSGVMEATFLLADETPLGAGWDVVARSASGAAVATAFFEVQQYSLPRFGVTVSLSQASLRYSYILCIHMYAT